MRRVLRPMNALRAFEAAARHLSFTRAADELCVTPSAVGQSVRTPERWLAAPLFARDPASRDLALTEAGCAYLPLVGRSLDWIATATAAVRHQPSAVAFEVAATAHRPRTGATRAGAARWSMSAAAEIAMFESGWFGRGDAFWRWVKTPEAKPYVEAFMQMHRRPQADEPLDILDEDDTDDLLDQGHLKVLARDIETRFGEEGP